MHTELPWCLIRGSLVKKYPNLPLRSQERPLSFLGDHDGEMDETEYFLASKETKNLQRASLGSNKIIFGEKNIQIIL